MSNSFFKYLSVLSFTIIFSYSLSLTEAQAQARQFVIPECTTCPECPTTSTDPEIDCLGVPGGSAVEDTCGCPGSPSYPGPDLGCGCGSPAVSGCDNQCGSTKVDDECGVCGGDNSSCVDCAGTPNGTAVDLGCGCDAGPADACGVCGGDGSLCTDCAGVPNGTAQDLGCGCDLPGPSGCDNQCGSTKVVDSCDVCGGDNSTCVDCAGVPNGTAVDLGCGCNNPAQDICNRCPGTDGYDPNASSLDSDNNGTPDVCEVKECSIFKLEVINQGFGTSGTTALDEIYIPGPDPISCIVNEIENAISLCQPLLTTVYTESGWVDDCVVNDYFLDLWGNGRIPSGFKHGLAPAPRYPDVNPFENSKTYDECNEEHAECVALALASPTCDTSTFDSRMVCRETCNHLFLHAFMMEHYILMKTVMRLKPHLIQTMYVMLDFCNGTSHQYR